MPPKARWQSGHAAACKAVYAGSIPTLASSHSLDPPKSGKVPARGLPDADVAKLVDAADFNWSARRGNARSRTAQSRGTLIP